MNSIGLDEVLKTISKTNEAGDPIPFAIAAVTCDLNRKKGGERLVFEKAVVCNPGEKKITHNRNSTINIKSFGTKEPRAIHPILITEFNGRSVTL
jgi:hypothetical protein